MPRKLDAKNVMRWLISHNTGMGQNGGKCLDYGVARKRFWSERDRNSGDQRYFWVEARGNRLRAYELRYLSDEGPVNVFVDAFICGKVVVKIERKLLVETPISDYREFLAKYKESTPTLEWWED